MLWKTKLFYSVGHIYASQHFFFKLIISCVMGNKAILQGQPYLCLSALFQFPSFRANNLLCCGKTKLFYSAGHIYAFQHFSNFLLFRLIIFCVVEKQSYSTVSAIFMPLNTFPLSSLLRFIISCVVGNKAILQCRPYLCLSALFHFPSF